MKKLLIFSSIALVSVACSKSPIQIGQVSIISNREIPANSKFELLQKFANSSTRQLVTGRATSITSAIDDVVKAVPGGEYLTNAKIYKNGRYFVVEGDVWGVPGQVEPEGIQIGGYTYLKRKGGLEKVRIISFSGRDMVNVELRNRRIATVDRERLVKKKE